MTHVWLQAGLCQAAEICRKTTFQCISASPKLARLGAGHLRRQKVSGRAKILSNCFVGIFPACCERCQIDLQTKKRLLVSMTQRALAPDSPCSFFLTNLCELPMAAYAFGPGIFSAKMYSVLSRKIHLTTQTIRIHDEIIRSTGMSGPTHSLARTARALSVLRFSLLCVGQKNW